MQTPGEANLFPDSLQRPEFDIGDRISTSSFDRRVREYITQNWPYDRMENGHQRRGCDLSGGEIPTSAEDWEPQSGLTDKSCVDCSAFRRDHFVHNLDIAQQETVFHNSPSMLETLETRDVPSATLCALEDCYSDVHTSFLGGVDFHLELQNYLKTIEGYYTTKSRSKNTLQCNFYDNYVPLKIYSSSRNLQTGAEEYFDVDESKSGSSFDSATSNCSQLEEVTNEMLLDVTQEKPPQQDDTTKSGNPQLQNSVNQTAGINSFQVFRQNKMAVLDFVLAESVKLALGDSTEPFEKIQPLDAYSSSARTSRKRSVLLKNFVDLLSTESMPQTSEGFSPHSSSSESIQNQQDTYNWSPTLQELIDIYSSVLKQNGNIRRNGNSLQLFSFLNEKLKEKYRMSELLHMSKDFTAERQTKKLVNYSRNNNDLKHLQDYVQIIQEILRSNLSISQIACLNNIISGLRDHSGKNLSEEQKMLLGVNEKIEIKCPKQKKKVRFETPHDPPDRIQKTMTKESKAEEKIEKPELSLPDDLESILKTCFSSEGVSMKKPEDEKMLVQVNLCGNHILVKGLSYFEDEKSLKGDEAQRKGTSQLIIENVTKKQDLWKNTISSILKIEGNKKQALAKKMLAKSLERMEAGGRGLEKKLQYTKVQHPMEAIGEMPKIIQRNSEGQKPSEHVVRHDQVSKYQPSSGKKKLRSSELLTPKRKIGKMSLAEAQRRPCRARPQSEKKGKQRTLPFRPFTTPVTGANPKSMTDAGERLKKCGDTSKEKNSTTGKSQATTSKQKAAPQQSSGKTQAKQTKSARGDQEQTIDPCKSEFLFSEEDEGFATPEEKPAADPADSSITSDSKTKESSIALLPPARCNECVSFLSEMIHSDSFLVNFPSHAVSQTELKALLKCYSDVKFYPGRLAEGKAKEEPFVTFVLTPGQQKQAELPERVVKVVKKVEPGKSEGTNATNTFYSEAETEAGTEEETLKSIEKFISYLSKFRRMNQNKKQQMGEKKLPLNPPKNCRKEKEIMKKLPPFRKAYHECQKRMMLEAAKAAKAKQKAGKRITSKGGLTNSDVFLEKFLDKLSNALENLKTNGKKGVNKDKEVEPPKGMEELVKHIPPVVSEAVKKAMIQPKEEKMASEGKVRPPEGEIELLDSLVSPETDEEVLGRRNSTYFDALEESGGCGEQMGGDSNRTSQPAAEGSMKLNSELNVEEKKKLHPVFTPSDEQLLSGRTTGTQLEEVLYNKISNSLEKGEVAYSNALFEGFLSRTENSNCDRLRNFLSLVQGKSRNIMTKMEWSVWMKVLTLVEEIFFALEFNKTELFEKASLQVSDIMVNNRRWDLGNPSQEGDHCSSVLDRIKRSLRHMKQRFTLRESNSQEVKTSEGGGWPEIKMYSTMSLPEMRKRNRNLRKQDDPQELRCKLQQHYFIMQYLLSMEGKTKNHLMALNIQDVKRKVEEKMQSLQRALERWDGEKTSRAGGCWSTVASVLRLVKSNKSVEDSRNGEVHEEMSLDRGQSYLDILRGLVKTWDTRLTIRSIQSECSG